MTEGDVNDLLRRDDEELRAIAYGRADDQASRMRADAAARILTSRNAAAAGRPAAAAAADDGATEDVETDSEDAPAHPRPWTRRPALLAAAFVAALALGGIIGANASAIPQAFQPDALSIFDRPEQPDEETALVRSFGYGAGEARRLGETNGVRVYAVRTLAGAFGLSGDLGSQICIVAYSEEEEVQFFATNCVPESVFLSQGINGVLTGVDITNSSVLSASRIVAFDWDPQGGVRLDDVTEGVITPASQRFSEQDLLQGLDLEVISTIREGSANAELAEQFPESLFGPVDFGIVGDELIDNVGIFASIAPAADAAGDAAAGDAAAGLDEVAVCLTAVREDAVVAHDCRPMSTFRTRGTRVSVDHDSGRLNVTLQTSGSFFLDSVPN